MHPALYWCYAVESLVKWSWCRQPAQLPVAHRAFYHTCCFERISVSFCLVFPLVLLHLADFPHPSCTLNPPSDSLQLRIEMVESNVCVFQLHDSIQTILFVYECNSERQ